MASGDGLSTGRARWLDATAVLAVLVTVILAARQLRPLAQVLAFLVRTGDPVLHLPRTAWPRAIAWLVIAILVLARKRGLAVVGAWLAVLYEVVVAGLRFLGNPAYGASFNLVIWPLLLALVAATLLTLSVRGRDGLELLGRRGKWLMAAAAATTVLSAMVIPFIGEVQGTRSGSADTGLEALLSVSSRLADTIAAVTVGLVFLLGVAAFVGVDRSVRGPEFVMLLAGAVGVIAIDFGLPRPFSVWQTPVASPVAQMTAVVLGVGLVLGPGLLLLRRRGQAAPVSKAVEADQA